jgi:hypothetical protein
MAPNFLSKDASEFLKAAKKSPLSLFSFIIAIVVIFWCVFACLEDIQIRNKDSTIQILEKEKETCESNMPSHKTPVDVYNVIVNDPDPKAQNIKGFSVNYEGYVRDGWEEVITFLKFSFYLVDSKGNNIRQDGQVTIALIDAYNKTLYSNSFKLKASNFSSLSQNTLSGANTVDGYEWTIPISEVNKSIASHATARLNYSTIDGKSIVAYIFDSVSVPEYSGEEACLVNEKIYSKNFKTLGLTKTLPNLTISVKGIGFFETAGIDDLWFIEHSVYSSVDNHTKKYLRVDLEFKNTGLEEYQINSIGLLDKTGNPYHVEFDPCNGFNVFIGDDHIILGGGETKRGYVLFENVSDNLPCIELKIQGNYTFNLPIADTNCENKN